MTELARRLRLLLRRLNVFDASRTNEVAQGNVSGPTVPRDTGGAGGGV